MKALLTYGSVESRGIQWGGHLDLLGLIIQITNLQNLCFLPRDLAGSGCRRRLFSRGRWDRGSGCLKASSWFLASPVERKRSWEVEDCDREVAQDSGCAWCGLSWLRSSSPRWVQKTDVKEGHWIAFRVAATTSLLRSEVVRRPGRSPGLHPPFAAAHLPRRARAHEREQPKQASARARITAAYSITKFISAHRLRSRHDDDDGGGGCNSGLDGMVPNRVADVRVSGGWNFPFQRVRERKFWASVKWELIVVFVSKGLRCGRFV